MPDSLRTLDLGPVPAGQRSSVLLDALETLPVGEAFVVVGGPDVKPVLNAVRTGQAAAVDWNVLENGPARVRVEVRRRSGRQARSISEYLEHDHLRLDGMLFEVERLLAEGALAHARERLAEFCCGLDRHITVEEEILFPHFEQATGLTNGPTTVMRTEHVEIRRWMANAAAALADGQTTAFADAVGRLKGVLMPHNMKEERILYPMADHAAAGLQGQDSLVRRMEAID